MGRVARVLAVVVVGLATVAVVAVGAVVGSRDVGRALDADVADAFAAAGIVGVGVDVEGREVRLSGAGADADMMARAERLALTVEGVRSVEAGEVVPEVVPTVAPQDAEDIELRLRGDDDVVFASAVPSATLAAAIGESVAAIRGTDVATPLAVDDALPPPRWWPRLEQVLHATSQVRGLRVSVRDETLRVGGRVSSPQAAARIQATVEQVGLLPTTLVSLDVAPGALVPSDAQLIEQVAVVFGVGDSSLDATAQAQLDQVADLLARNPAVSLAVLGHAAPARLDRGGTVSASRAQAVRDYLLGSGVPPGRLVSTGTGAVSVVGGDAQQYRRVDFRVEE